jgi:hypothetical protein
MEDIWFKDRVRSFTKTDLLWKRIQLDAEKLYTRLYTMIENGTSSFMFPLAESFAHDFGVRESTPSLQSSKSCMSSRLQMGVLVWFATEFIFAWPVFLERVCPVHPPLLCD